VTVEHAMRPTEVECAPQKVITLGQVQTHSTLTLGVTPGGVVKPWTDGWDDYLPEQVELAEAIGTELERDSG